MQLDSSLFLEGSSTLYLNVTFLRSLQGKAISGYPWCGHESVLPPEKYVEPTGPAEALCVCAAFSSPLCSFTSPSTFSNILFLSPHLLGEGPLGSYSHSGGRCVCGERGREKLKSIQAAWVISF